VRTLLSVATADGFYRIKQIHESLLIALEEISRWLNSEQGEDTRSNSS
jgi:hypothetical protein